MYANPTNQQMKQMIQQNGFHTAKPAPKSVIVPPGFVAHIAHADGSEEKIEHDPEIAFTMTTSNTTFSVHQIPHDSKFVKIERAE